MPSPTYLLQNTYDETEGAPHCLPCLRHCDILDCSLHIAHQALIAPAHCQVLDHAEAVRMQLGRPYKLTTVYARQDVNRSRRSQIHMLAME